MGERSIAALFDYCKSPLIERAKIMFLPAYRICMHYQTCETPQNGMICKECIEKIVGYTYPSATK